MWVQSSFADTLVAAPPRRRRRAGPAPPAARPAPPAAATAAAPAPANFLWVDRHQPLDCQQLAVHRGKVDEVERWLSTTQRDLCRGARVSPFLLVTGPAGCGKSACVRCVAKKLDIQLVEWVATAGGQHRRDATFRTDDAWEGPGDTIVPEGHLRRFADFMVRANRYGSVVTSGGGGARLVLVDDLPNALVYRRDEFYDVLRRYGRGARSPCVFVLSDGGARSDLSVLSVFPDSVQADLGMHQITFRPVANKQLVAAMERVLAAEAGRAGTAGVTHPGRHVVEQLAATGSGDVRAVINALQFVCVQGGQKKRVREEGRPKSKRPRQEASVGSRDASLGLFRAVGKIIYAKRGAGEEPPLPAHLAARRRCPLLEQQPEEVCSRAGVLPDTVVAHLHHNHVDFCASLEDAVTGATYISQADLLTADWQSRVSTLAYGSSVAARGVMFARPSSVSLGFRQFCQPRLTVVEQKRQRRLERLRLDFADWRITNEQLVTEMLPYLDKRMPGYRPDLSCLPEHDPRLYRNLHHPTLDSKADSSDEEEENTGLGIEEYED